MSRRVLVVSAHPDDETLGCGATIAKRVSNGDSVVVTILGDGVSSRSGFTLAELDTRLEQFKAAAAVLGARAHSPILLADNKFDTYPLLEIAKKVEDVIMLFNPEIIYTHSAVDLNIDHRLTHEAVLVATRPISSKVKEIYCFEVPSSTEWNFGTSFSPNVFVDVTETLSRKLDALNKYENEVREWPHPRSTRALTARANYWGSIVGCEAAEAFSLLRMIM